MPVRPKPDLNSYMYLYDCDLINVAARVGTSKIVLSDFSLALCYIVLVSLCGGRELGYYIYRVRVRDKVS